MPSGDPRQSRLDAFEGDDPTDDETPPEPQEQAPGRGQEKTRSPAGDRPDESAPTPPPDPDDSDPVGSTTPSSHMSSTPTTDPPAHSPPPPLADSSSGLTPRDTATTPIPPPTNKDRERLHRAAMDGLQASGFQSPRLTLQLKKNSSLRASLTQDQAGRIQPGERLTLELTDAYHLAPERAVAGLVTGLGLSVLGRKKQGELARLLIEYHDLWQRSREGRTLQSRIRRQRARKQGRGPRGTAHNLETIRDRLDHRFFGGRLNPVEITWSSREGYSVLGHHDGDLDTIVINRCLDHADVPETVVAYILYHELLHHTLGIQEVPGGRRSLHPPSFRRRERRFPHWQTADKYLEALCNQRRAIPYERAPHTWRVLWDPHWHQAPAASHHETPAATPQRKTHSGEEDE